MFRKLQVFSCKFEFGFGLGGCLGLGLGRGLGLGLGFGRVRGLGVGVGLVLGLGLGEVEERSFFRLVLFQIGPFSNFPPALPSPHFPFSRLHTWSYLTLLFVVF